MATDADRVKLAQAIKLMRDDWAAHLEMLQLQVDMTRERYQRLIKAGFTPEQALMLCSQSLSI